MQSQALLVPAEKRYLFLTAPEWRIGLLLSAMAGAVAAWMSLFISVWIGVTVFLVTLTAYHMRYAARYIIPFPHIAIMISVLQYVFAAWVSFYYPTEDPTYNIGYDLPFYLSYAGPVIAAICVGWSLSLRGIKPKIQPVLLQSHQPLIELDILLMVGLVAQV